MRLLCVVLAAIAASEEAEDPEVCLLSLNARRGREGLSEHRSEQMKWEERHQELQAWARSHAEAKTALQQLTQRNAMAMDGMQVQQESEMVEESGTKRQEPMTHNIDGFIAAQKASDDACHAQMLEAKRTLDGVAAKVVALSDQVEAQEAIIEGGTMEIKDATGKKADSDETKLKDDGVCDAKHQEAIDALDVYRDELRELEMIAKPEVRSSIAGHVDYAAEVKKHAESLKAKFNASNPLNVSLLSEASCEKAVAFLNARSSQAQGQPSPTFTALDCGATRQVLQEEFNKAYKEITELLRERTDEAETEKSECEELAKDEENVRQSGANQNIKDATKNIQAAREVLNALNIMLDSLKREADKLRQHILALNKECELEGDVSEHLTKIRELIRSLQECPGRNDFRLKVPEGVITH
jgi:hypothetical protein